jgi:hypothetical protein
MGRMAVWGQPCRGQISADPISTKSWEWCILYREAQIGRLEYGSSLHQVQAQDTLLKKLRVNFLPWGEKLQGIFFICGTRVWTQGLALARQTLYHMGHAKSPVKEFFESWNMKSLLGRHLRNGAQ